MAVDLDGVAGGQLARGIVLAAGAAADVGVGLDDVGDVGELAAARGAQRRRGEHDERDATAPTMRDSAMETSAGSRRRDA